MALVFHSSLLIACLIIAGIYLFAISLIFYLIERKMHLSSQIPQEMIENFTFSWFIINFIMEFMFFVAIPAMAFGFFYVILPLDAIRAGMAVALTALILGAIPFMMGLTMRIKFPLPFILFNLLSYLLKASGAVIIIGYLYSL
ncbi:MAG: hypothetical protein DRP35_05970 [Candidatus Zixiibacteriota bacterium]|nr:MAG: hypothetical protein DRP35_05970 [candidate division Zixibacteria bacterium]